MTTLLATRITVRIVAMSIFRCGIPAGGQTGALALIVKYAAEERREEHGLGGDEQHHPEDRPAHLALAERPVRHRHGAHAPTSSFAMRRS